MKTPLLSLAALLLLSPSFALSQEETNAAAAQATEPAVSSESATLDSPAANDAAKPDVANKAKELAAETQARVEEIADKVDQNEAAKKAADGVLGPIYNLAESLNFSAFHWLAFGLMATGVVSFALQLVLGKLAVLLKGSINLREILSDAIGFVISTLGLVLTTQAAAENSTFTHSPAAVLSATAFGVVFGFILYRWGQAQEVNAVAGQRAGQTPQNLKK